MWCDISISVLDMVLVLIVWFGIGFFMLMFLLGCLNKVVSVCVSSGLW